MSEARKRAYARISVQGKERWAEVNRETGELSLMIGAGGVPRGLSSPCAGMLSEPFEYLTPFCGRNVVGLAYNYRGMMGHRDKYDEPLVFLKGSHSALSAAGTPAAPGRVELPLWATSVWVEAELAIVVSQPCFEISAADARDCILGFCLGSDITARNILDRDHHLARSKALPGFAPLSPVVMSGIDPRGRKIETRINGEVFQSSNTSDMILDPWESLSLASKVIPLIPGDVVLTGTPAGAMDSLVKPGSRVSHSIEGIGLLDYSVVERSARRGLRRWSRVGVASGFASP